MAKSNPTPNYQWDTFHENGFYENGKLPVEIHYEAERDGGGLTEFNQCAQNIQEILKDCKDKGKGFRAYGSRWSLSYIAYHKERMHFNAKWNIKIDIEQGDLHENASFDHQNLFFFQCGNVIKDIHDHLRKKKKSIKASGASSGQTIGGVISTGVHGSAFKFGAVHDSVVGINLIIGPDPDDIVYLERSSSPALNQEFATKIGARVIRNDDMFNAALVGLGSFGFIHGVVIEAEDIYLLKRYIRRMTAQQAVKLAESLDFQNDLKLVDNSKPIDSKDLSETPYHYKIFVNPYKKLKRGEEKTYLVEFMYTRGMGDRNDESLEDVKKGLNPCLPYFLGRKVGRLQKKIPILMGFFEGGVFPEEDKDSIGILSDIFWDAQHQGPAFAISFAVDHRQSGQLLDIMNQVAQVEGPIPGAYAVRFVKASKATLAFTRFPVSCVIEMNGILWDEDVNPAMITLNQFTTKIIDKLKTEGIPFTMHWGKNADWGYPGLVEYMYGDKAKAWKEQRKELLSTEMAMVFSNEFLENIKLVDIPPQNT